MTPATGTDIHNQLAELTQQISELNQRINERDATIRAAAELLQRSARLVRSVESRIPATRLHRSVLPMLIGEFLHQLEK
jgi:peptidoglycan hydrolase CwlO-like protein